MVQPNQTGFPSPTCPRPSNYLYFTRVNFYSLLQSTSNVFVIITGCTYLVDPDSSIGGKCWREGDNFTSHHKIVNIYVILCICLWPLASSRSTCLSHVFGIIQILLSSIVLYHSYSYISFSVRTRVIIYDDGDSISIQKPTKNQNDLKPGQSH